MRYINEQEQGQTKATEKETEERIQESGEREKVQPVDLQVLRCGGGVQEGQ